MTSYLTTRVFDVVSALSNITPSMECVSQGFAPSLLPHHPLIVARRQECERSPLFDPLYPWRGHHSQQLP